MKRTIYINSNQPYLNYIVPFLTLKKHISEPDILYILQGFNLQVIALRVNIKYKILNNIS